MSKFTNASKVATVCLWVARILLAAFFLSAAVSKLAGADRSIKFFNEIGWGQWFRYLTAAMELAAAVMLLVPATGAIGALGLLMISVGAVVSLFALGKSIIPAAITLVWSAILLVALRDQLALLTQRCVGRYRFFAQPRPRAPRERR